MKELLAVKKAMKKFEFHLIGYHFLVETDFSGFQGMLTFKNKRVLNAQLVHLAMWFNQYSFDVNYIKGKQNLIPDLLSRLPLKPINIISINPYKTIPLIYTMAS